MRNRVNLTMDADSHDKLLRLSQACMERPATIALELVTFCLNNPAMLNHMQAKYEVSDKFKIIPRIEGSKMFYD